MLTNECKCSELTATSVVIAYLATMHACIVVTDMSGKDMHRSEH